MQRAPASGDQAGLAAAVVVEPTTVERLEHVSKLLAENKPWPAFLHIGARATEEWEACPTVSEEALTWMTTSAVGVLGVASVGPLVPVCEAFKALIEAAEGAAESQDKLQSLVSQCAFLATVLIQHGRAVGPLTQVHKPIQDFVVTTNELAGFAARWAKGGKCRAFFCHHPDLSALAGFEKCLRRIRSGIALVHGLEHHQSFLAALPSLLPPSLPDMAAVPAGALDLPGSSYVERAAVQEVADGLTAPEESRAPYTVVGMGGGGKSVLASAVVRKPSVREHFRGGIFWVRVGRGAKSSLLALLQGLAREMGAAPTDAPHGVPHVLDSLEQVQQHLAAVASTGTSPRLVILDDVWEREVVDAFLPLGFKVLLTTRDRSVVGVPAGRLELGDMTEEEALELLRKTSGTVVALCGHLPLVLAIVGSMPVVKGKGLRAGAWEELAKELENVAKKMRARGEQSSSIKVVLETSFDSLAVRKQEEFLKMAVLAAGALAPIEMLRNLWEIGDAESTRDEAEGLVSKCLLHAVGGGGGGGYRVHDLVLEFAKTGIRAEKEALEKATSLQAQYLGRLDVLKSYGNPEHGAGDQGLFFLDALWRSVKTLSGDPELEVASYRASLGGLKSCEATEAVARSCGSVGFLFNIQGKYAEAEPLYERSQAIQEKVFGPKHQVVATLLNNRAALFERQGKYTEAEPFYERSQALREKVLGPEHPDVAATLINRAGLLEKQGKYDKAELLYRRSLAIHEKVYGRDHPDVATDLNNWAGLLERQGKYAEADPLYERCQAIFETALGPEHPSVATALNNRAGLLETQGKYEEAEPMYEHSQAIREKTLGPDHPAVATVLNNRAGLLKTQGKYAEATPLHERSQAIREKALGPEHPDVATSLNNRAGLLESQGKYEEIEPLSRCSLAVDEHVYGPTDVNKWTGLLSIWFLRNQRLLYVTTVPVALSLVLQGKYAEAEPLYARSHAILEKVVGPEHPDVASSLNNRAKLLRVQGKYAEADPLYLRAIEIGEKTLGPNHPALATRLNNRAGLLQRQGKYEEAEPLYRRSLAIKEKVHGPDHPDVARVLNNWAGLLKVQGKYAEAEPLFERVQALQEKVLGPEHPDVAATLNDRAGLLERQGKYEEAGPLYRRSLAINKRVHGPDHPSVARDLNNWAGLLKRQGKYAEAESFYERSQAIREEVLGPEHPDVAVTLNNRAGLLERQGKYEEAEPLYRRSLAIDEKVLGPNHPEVATVLNNWAGLLKVQGKYAEAEPFYERAQALRETVLGPNHPDVAATLNDRAGLLERQGKYEEAEPLYKRSLAIDERFYGLDHPEVATHLNNWAGLLETQEKYTGAIPLLERALSILTKRLGFNHPDTVSTQNSLEVVRKMAWAQLDSR
ncbi:NB-ARC and TPR repeat-containing protein-likely pseudogene [Ectocarpus siliculosus]|nr:NB-ARC and TPR repeat-containing protein-likely pseudogene [Ectocarpus siliculosus]|eukprot:CBJ32852.1 NB-ARC and TPR repeat-containing protein-likely pseudogene [Ectocarpus siliculosus]